MNGERDREAATEAGSRPLLLASPIESFRLHYASRQATQVLNYAGGWAEPEAGFRWAIAEQATLIVPL